MYWLVLRSFHNLYLIFIVDCSEYLLASNYLHISTLCVAAVAGECSMYLLIPHGCGNTTTHCCLSLSVQNVEVRPACSNVNTTLHRVHAMPIVFYADCLDCFVSSFQTWSYWRRAARHNWGERAASMWEHKRRVQPWDSNTEHTVIFYGELMVESTMSDTATIINVFVLSNTHNS